MSQKNLDNIRHSLAHLLAAAVLRKFPEAKLGIGPVIEDGFYYDFKLPRSLSPDDLKGFERTMRDLIRQKLPFRGRKTSAAEAKGVFKNQPFKLDLIKEFVKEKNPLTIYETGDVFKDLCRGGHVKNTGEINPDTFMLDRTAGAYWRGDEKNPQLQRIYGVAFATKKELMDYLKMREEAKKRDHRELGQKLEIFTFSDEVGAGLPLWLPKGVIIRDELEKWAREIEEAAGYQRVVTPHITKEELYKISGHVPYYTDDMYSPTEIENEKYYLKPMNCPHHHMIYKSRVRSYKELPLRFTEYGQLYRYERSGTLHGLFRTRGFCQNDAHIYVAEKDVIPEFVRVMDMHHYYYKKLGIKNFKVKLGLRDPKNLRRKYHGDDKMWNKAEKLTKQGLEKARVKYAEDVGGAAHYGPKGDVIIESVIGKEYAIGTIQIDLFMPIRFDLSFINEKGEKERPVIIHRAPLGSHERMVAFLIEHFAGNFPTWLSPTQVAVLAVSRKHQKYAEKIYKLLKDRNIRAELTSSDETLGKRIREAELQKIPYMLIVGDKEMKAKNLSVRERHKDKTASSSIESFLEKITKEITERK
ncbi:MAG: threonine--tRNA ligase [Candidatus Brennerbacteria bacterium]|nr:threonine--tRNA ligase [Candidatus Brennerbacteria bacterium]